MHIDRNGKEKQGSGKLMAELRLYRLFWEECPVYNVCLRGMLPAQGHPVYDEDFVGVSFWEIRGITNATDRTLNRYLRELEDVCAITPARFHTVGGNRHCKTYLLAYPYYKQVTDKPRYDAHLRRLARTLRLMIRYLEGENDVPWYHRKACYTNAFFEDMIAAENWYYDNCENVPSGTPAFHRFIQRDTKLVWESLRDEDRERER